MKKTKVGLAALMVLALASCGENSSAYKALQAKYDSVNLVNQAYESDLSETDSLVASVLNNFQDIASVGQMIDTSRARGEVKMSEKERIKDNVTLITDKLRSSAEALDVLTKKLEASGAENTRLRRTLTALKRELATQHERVLALTEELQRKDLAIGLLDSMVTSLNSDVERLGETTRRQTETLAAQEAELNTVRYCIGTARDLKDYNILKGSKVSTDQVDPNYFTTADLRNLTQIPLMSKKAQLLTVHPSSSYELIADGDKMLTLNIKNPQAFWSNAKTLIIRVD